MREIKRDKAERQVAFGGVGELCLHGRACFALLRDRGETVVGDRDDVGGIKESKFAQRRADTRQVVVGIADRGERCRAVDARNE